MHTETGLRLQSRVLVAVFSYNRPAELANCLRSLRDMCPGSDVVIFDDQSNHPDMNSVFDHFGHPVEHGTGGWGRHGGLYFNMQAAYERALAGGYDEILMLQEDQQLLRPLDETLFAEYHGYFDALDDATQIDLRFAISPVSRFELCTDVKAYRQKKPAYRGYVDVGLFRLARLQKFNWSFAIHSGYATAGEAKKAAEARAKGMRAVVAYSPCLSHVPCVTVYRNRMNMPSLTGAVSRRHAYLTEEDIARLDARPPEEIPGCDAYLRDGAPVQEFLDEILAKSPRRGTAAPTPRSAIAANDR